MLVVMETIYADINQQRKICQEFDVFKTIFDVGVVSEYNCFWVYLWSLNKCNLSPLLKIRVNTTKGKNYRKTTVVSNIYKELNNVDFYDYKYAIKKILKVI